MQYVYIDSEPSLFTVGFYDHTGKWHPESDHPTRHSAGERVRWLNGGRDNAVALPASLRDWFAGQALASGDMPCRIETTPGQARTGTFAKNAAEDAYFVADAMLAQREKLRGPVE